MSEALISTTLEARTMESDKIYMNKFGKTYSEMMHVDGGMGTICKECKRTFGEHMNYRCPGEY